MKGNVKSNVEVRDHCHINEKYRGSAHKCNIKVKSKTSCCFPKLKKLWFSSYYSRTRQIQLENKHYTKWIGKIYELQHNIKLALIDSFQFFSSPLDSLVKNLGKDDFNCLNQEFYSN